MLIARSNPMSHKCVQGHDFFLCELLFFPFELWLVGKQRTQLIGFFIVGCCGTVLKWKWLFNIFKTFDDDFCFDELFQSFKTVLVCVS